MNYVAIITHIYYLIVSVDGKPRCGLAEPSSSGTPQVWPHFKPWLERTCSWAQSGGRGYFLRSSRTGHFGNSMAVFLPGLLAMWASPRSFSQHGFIEWTSKTDSIFCNRTSEARALHICCILFITSESLGPAHTWVGRIHRFPILRVIYLIHYQNLLGISQEFVSW